MERSLRRFLALSALSMVVICVLAFTWLSIFLSNGSEKAVKSINEIYMSEINAQLYQKFDVIISFRQDQVKSIIENNPPEDAVYGDDMKTGLAKSLRARGFDYMALITMDGRIENIYGEPVKVVDMENALKSLEHTGLIVEQGVVGSEKKLVLGQKARYPMSDGTRSDAVIMGISMDYLNKALYLYKDNNDVYSQLIAPNGDFIIRNGDAFRENYFDRLLNMIDKDSEKTPQQYVDEFKDAISKGAVYQTSLKYAGEDRYIYCSQISDDYCNWYLVSIMTSDRINEVMKHLSTIRFISVLVCSASIFAVMIAIFLIYYRMSQRYMKELNEAQKEAVHANAAKSEFLSSMSHDIRTPMNAIVGMTEIAIKNKDNPLRVEDCLDKIKLSSKHLLGLINDVLDMSKIESGKMTLNNTVLSLRETIDDIVNIVKPQVKANNQFFDIFIEKIQTEDVYCDSTRLNQVLLNILSNAMKFTPAGGSIDVYLYQEDSPVGSNYIRTHFRVKDTGIGMSKEFQKKVFDSFAREDNEEVQNISGTGLGMAITKHIVDLMNGTINVKSELGEGTEFHIILDLEKANIKEEEMKLPEEWNVLVVDDNDQLCSSAVSNLEELGVNAESALDGKTAISMVEKRYSENRNYDFALIDWKMPHMDGLEVIKEIRKKIGDHTPIFLISAYDWSDIEDEAVSANIKGFISKPLFKSKLYSVLSKFGAEGRDSAVESNAEYTYNDAHIMDFTGRRILVAEDIDMNWEIADEILSSAGLVLERAANGRACVDMFETSDIGYYDAILMDIRMPVMNGYEATKAIRQLDREDKDIPIIAMTADAFSDDVQHCLDCGMNDHTAKPINIKELFVILQRYLDK